MIQESRDHGAYPYRVIAQLRGRLRPGGSSGLEVRRMEGEVIRQVAFVFGALGLVGSLLFLMAWRS